MEDISIFVSSIGYYNEGILTGDWLTLPVSEETLKKYLIEKVLVDREHEEIFITDYEAPFQIGEYDGVYALNRLAAALTKLADENDDLADKVIRSFDVLCANSYSERMNVIMQAESIPFIEIESFEDFGREFAEGAGWNKEMIDAGADFYFDYEAYGTDLLVNENEIDDGLYIVGGQEPNLEMYDKDDIAAYVDECMEEIS